MCEARMKRYYMYSCIASKKDVGDESPTIVLKQFMMIGGLLR